MIAAMRALAALILIMAWQPLSAHGENKHGENQVEFAEQSPNTNAQALVGSASAYTSEATANDRTDQEANTGSIWTSLHPATVHFPIALLLAAAIAELAALMRPSARLTNAATVMAWGGAAGAVIAALFGWVHTGIWFGGDATMQWHRWTGTGLAFVAPIVALLAMRPDRRPFRILLFLVAAALMAQAYWGGELAHGPNHLGF